MSVATNCLNREGLEPKATELESRHMFSHRTVNADSALETRNLFYFDRKRKSVMIQISRYKGRVLDSFLAPETNMIFRDGVGAFFVNLLQSLKSS